MKRVMIIPAAGRGSRLGSPLPKLLVPVNGRAMIDFVLDRHREFADLFVVVVGPSFLEPVKAHLAGRPERVALAVQAEPTGMLDAMLVPLRSVLASEPEEVWVTWCDQVAVSRETVLRLVAAIGSGDRPLLGLPTVQIDEPYIHFDRDRTGRITGVRQRREGAEMPPAGEADIGLFALSRSAYGEWLPRYAAECEPGAGTRERNFLPFIPWLVKQGGLVATVPAADPLEAVGINTPDDLRRIETALARAAR